MSYTFIIFVAIIGLLDSSLADDACDENPCLNDGDCQPTNFTTNGFYCKCKFGISGIRCGDVEGEYISFYNVRSKVCAKTASDLAHDYLEHNPDWRWTGIYANNSRLLFVRHGIFDVEVGAISNHLQAIFAAHKWQRAHPWFRWNKQWRSNVPGKMSVIGVAPVNQVVVQRADMIGNEEEQDDDCEDDQPVEQ